MSGLINITDFYALQRLKNDELFSEVVALNEVSAEYGLTLTESQIIDLMETRGNALHENNRIEIGLGAVKKIIENFCSSSFINNDNYSETLNELVEMFYYYKTESHDSISDNDLINMMFDHFENKYFGSIKMMQSKDFNFINKYEKKSLKTENNEDFEQDPDSDDFDDYMWDDDHDQE